MSAILSRRSDVSGRSALDEIKIGDTDDETGDGPHVPASIARSPKFDSAFAKNSVLDETPSRYEESIHAAPI
jgi:hypothetical protein